MRKPSTRKITTPATTAATKPAKATIAKQAAAARATVATAAPTSTTVDNTPAPAAVPAVAKPAAGITRTAATIVAQRTNFGNLSDRDTAYITFYASLAKRSVTGVVTLADIVASGQRPVYVGSNKPHDAGVINRLAKANLLTASADGTSFSFRDAAKTHAAYAAG